MEYDFAILYFGMTRSIRKVYQTHIQHIYEKLDGHNMTYKKKQYRPKPKKQNLFQCNDTRRG